MSMLRFMFPCFRSEWRCPWDFLEGFRFICWDGIPWDRAGHMLLLCFRCLSFGFRVFLVFPSLFCHSLPLVLKSCPLIWCFRTFQLTILPKAPWLFLLIFRFLSLLPSISWQSYHFSSRWGWTVLVDFAQHFSWFHSPRPTSFFRSFRILAFFTHRKWSSLLIFGSTAPWLRSHRKDWWPLRISGSQLSVSQHISPSSCLVMLSISISVRKDGRFSAWTHFNSFWRSHQAVSIFLALSFLAYPYPFAYDLVLSSCHCSPSLVGCLPWLYPKTSSAVPTLHVAWLPQSKSW